MSLLVNRRSLPGYSLAAAIALLAIASARCDRSPTPIGPAPQPATQPASQPTTRPAAVAAPDISTAPDAPTPAPLAPDARAHPTPRPVAVAAAVGPDWPAFHGGGELRGEAAPIPFGSSLVARWTFRPDDPSGIEGGAAIVGKYAYIGDGKGRLYCLALSDGKPKWTYTVEDSGFAATPLVMNGRVYIGDMSGIFHCISAEDGKKIWTYDVESGQPIHAGANVLGDRLIYGDDGANIVCLNTEGKLQWKYTAGDRVNGAPAIGHGMAFISGCDMRLRGIEIATGKQIIDFELPSLAPGSPALIGDRLIIGIDQGQVVCVSAKDPKILWTYNQVKDDALVAGSPAVSQGIAVVGARDNQVHAMNVEDGSKRWTFAARGEVNSAPVISGGRVYVGSMDKSLYVLDLKTGAQLGEFKGRFAIDASPAVGQGVVVVGDGRGAVYCLEGK